MIDLLIKCTGGKAGRVDRQTRALRKIGLFPSYAEQMTAEHGAWALQTFAQGPASEAAVMKWAKRKKEFWEKQESAGIITPLALLSMTLEKEELYTRVESAMIENVSGLTFITYLVPDGSGRFTPQTKRAGEVTDVNIDYDNYSIQAVTMIRGALIRQLGAAIAGAAIEAEAMKN